VANLRTVCVVDDDDSLRGAIRSLFRSLEYQVEAFSNGADAIEWLSSHDAHCLISDVQMPGMSGIDMYLSLLSRGRRIPTIFITAYPTDVLHSRTLAAGALAFLVKPVDIPKLTELVASAVSTNSL
jgi:FixJ family two-component response regulator